MINWDTRYRKVVSFLEENLGNCSLLEIGSGPIGISKYIESHVVGLEFSRIESESTNLSIQYGDVRSLAYGDGEFDVVLCSDVLEHLSPDDRVGAINECIRVAKRIVLIQNPTGYLAFEAEKLFFESLNSINWESPRWLREHIDHGFPIATDVLKAIYNSGYASNVEINEYCLQHYSGLFIDFFYRGASAFSNIISSKCGSVAQLPNYADVPYSLLFTVNKEHKLKIETQIFTRNYKRFALNRNCKVTVFSIFDRHFDISNSFKSIIPFFVKDDPNRNNFSVNLVPDGFLEIENDRASEISAFSNIIRKKFTGDVTGFCHYRRFLNLNTVDGENSVKIIKSSEFDFYLSSIDNPELVLDQLSDCDALVAKPIPLNNTIENQYCVSHYASDFYNLHNYISANHAYLLPYFYETMNSTELYGSNLIIGRTDLIEYIFEIVFDCLESLGSINNVENRTKYQTRDLAFLSERIFDTVIRFLIGNNFNFKFLQRIHLEFS